MDFTGNTLLVIFIVFISIRELIYHYTTHRLINKLMSRDFHDYQFSKNIKKTMDTGQELKEGLKAEQGLQEDLSPINSFLG